MDSSSDEEESLVQKQQKGAQAKKGSFLKNLMGKTKGGSVGGQAGAGKEGEGGHTGEKGKNSDGTIGAQQVPTTYPEMFMFNAAVMGFGQSAWMSEVLACFDNIVTNVATSARLQEER